MREYPITVEKVDYAHKGGTKEYHHIFLTNAQGARVVIRRWGAIGKAVQVMADINPAKTDDWYSKDRIKGGYKPDPSKVFSANDAGELRAVIGRAVWAKLGPTTISAITPSFDVSSMKENDGPDYDEDGRRINKQTATSRAVAEAEEQRKRQEQEAANSAMMRDPMFGAFG